MSGPCLAIGGSLGQCLVLLFSLQGLFCCLRELQQIALDNTVWFGPIALRKWRAICTSPDFTKYRYFKGGRCPWVIPLKPFVSQLELTGPIQPCTQLSEPQPPFFSSLWSLSLHIWVISQWPWQLYYSEQSPVSASNSSQAVADV